MTGYLRVLIDDLDLTSYPYSVGRNPDMGAPSVRYSETRWDLVRDGVRIVAEGADRRTMEIFVYIEGPDFLALAESERELALACSKPGTLTFDPGDGIGPPSIFDRYAVEMEEVQSERKDDMAFQLGMRMFRLTIPALPYVRTADPVVVESLPAGSSASVTTIDACDALTGWDAGTRSLTLGTSSPDSGTGYLAASAPLAETQQTSIPGGTRVQFQALLLKTFSSINMAGSPFIVLRTRGSLGPVGVVLVVNPIDYSVGGREAQLVASEVQPNGWTAHWFYTAEPIVTRLLVRTSQTRDFVGGATLPHAVGVDVDTIQRSTQAAVTGTGRAQMRSITVQGAYRTPGSLRLKHETAALGEVMLVTCPDLANGWRPDLRRWRTDGATATTDANMVSGSRSSVAGDVFTIPARILRAGSWVLLGRLRRTSGSGDSTISATARLRVGTTDLGVAESFSVRVSFPSSAWRIVPLGRLHLPPVAVAPESGANVRLSVNNSGATPEWDELWLVPSDAEVTLLNGVGIGTPSLEAARFSALRLDAPTVQQPRGGAWAGTQPDWSDALSASPWLERLGRHELAPSETLIYAVTTGAANASLSAEYFPLAHSNSAGAPGAA